RGRLARRAGPRTSAEAGRERPVVLDVARGEHHLVPCVHPDGADRAAHVARADDADFHLLRGVNGERQGGGRNGSPGDHKKSSTILVHGNPPSGGLSSHRTLKIPPWLRSAALLA